METNISNTAISNLSGVVKDFKVQNQELDSPNVNETYWNNDLFTKWLGYYKTIPELKKAIDALITYVVGKGWETDVDTKVRLEFIKGWGEDSFQSILENLLTIMLINGDAYAEIIRDPDTNQLLNLKPLNPSRVRIVVNDKGMINRYEYLTANKNGVQKKFQPDNIFHISNNRLGDEIHGTSAVEVCQWVIDARNEAMSDLRRIMHRTTIRVMYIDADDTEKIAQVKNQYANAIQKGELMIIPAKKGEAEFEDLSVPPVTAYLELIRYYESFFYVAIGVNKSVINPEGFNEASSKVGYLGNEPFYVRLQTLTEADLLAQLNITLKFNRPASLGNMMQESEEKNTSQTGFQPNELQASVTKNE